MSRNTTEQKTTKKTSDRFLTDKYEGHKMDQIR